MAEPAEPTLRLVAGAQAGDPAARAALMERYHQRVLSIVRVRMGSVIRSRLESQDLVQSVMLESLKDLGQFRGETDGAFLHWLGTMAERKIRDKVDYLTAQKRDARLEVHPEAPSPDSEEESGEAGFAGPAHDRTPSMLASQTEELIRLEEAIRKLPPDQAELVVMSRLEELSYEEIAERTGKSPEAVRKAAARAMARLVTLLAR